MKKKPFDPTNFEDVKKLVQSGYSPFPDKPNSHIPCCPGEPVCSNPEHCDQMFEAYDEIEEDEISPDLLINNETDDE
jgi:hypothetical protein